jgi:hypothetical protein
MGNRFEGGIKKGAMPPLHRYLGNPVLSGVGRLFFKCPISDFHCGLRGYNTERMRGLDLRTIGMEYASEMVVQAQINGYKISEVPTTLSPDGRSRPPHLRSWRDGWRHLKFLLMHCPNWLFLYPGIALIALGSFLGIAIEVSAINFFGAMLDINTLLYCAVMVIVGFNLISFHTYAKVYAINARFIVVKKTFAEKLDADSCALAGILAVFIGIAVTLIALILWGREGFGELNPEMFMRITIPSATLISVGVQFVFSGFFIDILRIKIKSSQKNTRNIKNVDAKA